MTELSAQQEQQRKDVKAEVSKYQSAWTAALERSRPEDQLTKPAGFTAPKQGASATDATVLLEAPLAGPSKGGIGEDMSPSSSSAFLQHAPQHRNAEPVTP